MSFRRHIFPEVLDALLTKLVGGEAAESHPFPPDDKGPPFKHSLLRPNVVDIVSVYGSLNGDPHLFRKNADYALQNGNTLQWATKGADLPDEGTLIYVNYTTQSAQPVVTDIQTGSVVRTLSESFGLEIASLYAQLQTVYDSGFVDTATGAALDKVVALLGIQRVRGGRAARQIEFTRVQGSRGTITVPAGTRIRGRFPLATLEEIKGGVQTTWNVTVEREGSDKPCCVAEWLVRYYED